MTLRKPGKFWIAHISVHGKEHSFSTRQTEYHKALKMAKGAWIEEMESLARMDMLTNKAVTRLVAGRAKTVEQAVADWISWVRNGAVSVFTVRIYEKRVEEWMRQAGVVDQPLASVTNQHISDYLNNANSKNKLSTRTYDATVIRMFFDWARKEGIIDINPAANVRVRHDLLSHKQKTTKVKKLVSDEDLQKLLAQAKPGTF